MLMPMPWKPALAVALLALVPACSGNDPSSQQNQAIRAAVDSSQITLQESVSIAEASRQGSVALKATLLTRSSLLSVGTFADGALTDVRIGLDGVIQSTEPLSGDAPSCEGSVSLGQAIAAAEAAVNGEAVVVQPDDDDACDREVKVLDGADVLYEVKIAPDGTVKESEIADDADETDA